jgi:hypothetical protein
LLALFSLSSHLLVALLLPAWTEMDAGGLLLYNNSGNDLEELILVANKQQASYFSPNGKARHSPGAN